ncbi:MAG: hypothetical protein AB8G96_15530 [Phycisphaerales bacterium]
MINASANRSLESAVATEHSSVADGGGGNRAGDGRGLVVGTSARDAAGDSAGDSARESAGKQADFPASGVAGPHGNPIAWPERDPAAVASLVHDMPIDVINRHEFVDRPDRRFTVGERMQRGRLAATRLAGVGVIRQWVPEPEAGPATPDAAPDAADPQHLIFVSSWTAVAGTGGPVASESAASSAPAALAPSAAPDAPLAEDPHWGVRMQYRPAPPDVPARGIVVHLHGLDGHGLERRVTRRLHAAGWGVLECTYPLVNWQRLEVDVADPQSVSDAGRRMASIIDERFGELAFAAEAAVADLQMVGDPAASAGPIFVTAFSAGANAASAVVARLGPRVEAAAIMLGGADLMRISADSSLTDTGFDMRRGDRQVARGSLTEAERAAISEAYLQHAAMDGWTIAPHLDVPCLLVLGRFDAIVPRGAGALLRERLGRPETWWIFGGHYGGYVSMPWVGPRIARWLLRQSPGA